MLITVIVTNYNRQMEVRRALLSVLCQSYEPLQVIVVEDGSNSRVQEWVHSEGLEGNVEYIRHDSNRGLAAARNTGLQHARGEWIAYLDDDDHWKPEMLSSLWDLVQQGVNEPLGVVYCGVEVRDPITHGVVSILMPEINGAIKSEFIRRGLSTRSSSSLFAQQALRAVGGFDETVASSIDHDIWMTLADHGYHTLGLDQPLTISYASRHGKMTTDVPSRIAGVRGFTNKWEPTFKEWLGDSEGTKYARAYYARVIGLLAIDNIANGKVVDGTLALRAVIAYSGALVGLRYMVPLLARVSIRNILPRRILTMFRGVNKT